MISFGLAAMQGWRVSMVRHFWSAGNSSLLGLAMLLESFL